MTFLATLLLTAAALVLLAAIGAWAWSLRASVKPCGGLTHDVAGRHKARRVIRYVERVDDEYVAQRFRAIAKENTDLAKRGRALIKETR